MRDVINLTPHPIYFLDDEGNRVGMLPGNDDALRMDEDVMLLGALKLRVYCPECEGKNPSSCGSCYDGTVSIETDRNRKNFYPHAVEDLPPEDGTLYIVPKIVSEHTNRDDFLVPDTVRDEDGRVIGCTALSEIE